jgi:putative peptidoglycan lipid II flippase
MSRKVLIASIIWGASILLSRIIGLVREAVIGRVLGGGREADVYFVAFTLPDYLYYLLAGSALSIVFIPIFGAHLARGEEERGWESFSVIANFLLILLAVLLPVLWVSLPLISPLLAPGFDAGQSARLVRLTRIMLPAQAFHLLGGLLSAALQAKDRHTLPALAPLLYTLGIILGGLAGGSRFGAEGFAWGVLLGSAVGPFGVPLLGTLGAGLRWSLTIKLRHPDLKSYLLRSLPIMLALSIVVVDDWVLRRLGSLLGEGAVATMNYAKQLMRVPMGVFGMAAGVAAFPSLTRMIAADDRKGAYDLLSRAIRHMLVLAFGAQVVLTVAGPEISRLVYGSRISAEQHAAIGHALGIFSLGLWAWAAQTLVARGFYAMGNTWIPSILGTILVPISYPLYVSLGNRWGTNGLAVASTIAITLYIVILMRLLRRYFDYRPAGYPAFFGRIIPAVTIGISSGILARSHVTVHSTLLRAALLVSIGVATYFGAAALLRAREISEYTGALRTRLSRIF